MRERLPELFEDSARYDTDLFELLDRQQALYQQLATDPAYQTLSRSRGAYQSISLQARGQQEVVVRSLDPRALMDLRRELSGVVDSLPSAGDFAATLMQAILDRQAKLEKVSPQHLAVGLIRALPAQRQNEVLRMAPELKFEVLRRELPENLSASGFDASRFGYSNLSRHEALSLLESGMSQEKELLYLSEAHILLQDGEGKVPQRKEDAVRQLKKIEEKDLDYFVDKADYKKRAQHIVDQAPKDRRTGLAHVFRRPVARHVDSLLDRTVESRQVVTGKLVLEEVPPALGIFRGCVGSDCATRDAFAYPNSPSERVFYIYDENKKIKGYVAGTVLKTGEAQPSLYLHTINGKRLNGADTLQVIQGLHDARAELGVGSLVLPTDEKIDQFSNFAAIQEAMKDSAREGKIVALEYPDAEIRENLDGAVEVSAHDSASVNKTGRVYRPRQALDVEAAVSPSNNFDYKFRKPRKTDALLLALDFNSSQREKSAKRAAQLAGLSGEQFKELAKLLQNEDALPVAEYENQSRKALSALGLSMSDETLAKRDYVFLQGRLRSKDALSEVNLERTVSLVFQQLNREDDAEEALSIIDEAPEIFAKDPRMQRHFDRLFAELPFDYDSVIVLHKAGLPGTMSAAGFQRLIQNPDVAVRNLALKALGESVSELGESEELEKLILQMLDDPDPWVAGEALVAAAKHTESTPAFEARVIAQLKAEKTQAAAARALAEMELKEPESIQVLVDIYQWYKRDARFSAAYMDGLDTVLGMSRTDERSLQILMKALEDPDLRLGALQALARSSSADPRIEAALLRALETLSGDKDTAKTLVLIFGERKLSSDTLLKLLKLMESHEPGVAFHAYEILNEIRPVDDEFYAELEKLHKRGNSLSGILKERVTEERRYKRHEFDGLVQGVCDAVKKN